tara:strand:- start:188 stop:589 length:402 start_codon:yes stop_codon:yes gene_type:complete
MKQLMTFLIISLFLSGCMSSATPVESDSITYENEERIIQSYQFWNENPMSIGKETVFNHTGMLDCDIKVFNHDGGNLTVIIPDVFEESYGNTTATFTAEITANNTLRTLHGGFHDPEASPIGDFYVVSCFLYY